MMRARKRARQRRFMSPEHCQIALHSALTQIRGIIAYFWSKKFCKRGYPSVRIIVLRGWYGFQNIPATETALLVLLRELEYENLHIVVTYSESAFEAMQASERS
jgi:hypothetical protein